MYLKFEHILVAVGGDTTVSSVIHHQQHIAAVRNPPTRKGELTVLFTIDYPEILLVEDSMNPDTNALMFEVNNKEFS